MTKHDPETQDVDGIGARTADFVTIQEATFAVPPLPAAVANLVQPPCTEPSAARRIFERNLNKVLSSPFDVNNDGHYIGNIVRPGPFNNTRNLPYEHPARTEWDNPRYDRPELNFELELLPTGWLPQQYGRLRAWEFGMFFNEQYATHFIEICWKAYHGLYEPKLLLFGCNAIWLDPYPDVYPYFEQFPQPVSGMLLTNLIGTYIAERHHRANKLCESQTDLHPDDMCIMNLARHVTIAQSNKPVCFVATKPGFHWKYPDFDTMVKHKPVDDPIYPRLDLCDDQYDWDRHVYDQPDLDFSTEPTLPGYTRLQFLRRRAWEQSRY